MLDRLLLSAADLDKDQAQILLNSGNFLWNGQSHHIIPVQCSETLKDLST